MDFPLEDSLDAILIQGNIFYFVERTYTSPHPHNFVLLNPAPGKDQGLVFVGGTSNIEYYKRLHAKMPPSTLVIVKPSDCNDFRIDTLFDCNLPTRKSFADLVDAYKATRQSDPKGRLPAGIVQRLIVGVLASPMVEGEVKALLR